jgi:hypothetical protein
MALSSSRRAKSLSRRNGDVVDGHHFAGLIPVDLAFADLVVAVEEFVPEVGVEVEGVL